MERLRAERARKEKNEADHQQQKRFGVESAAGGSDAADVATAASNKIEAAAPNPFLRKTPWQKFWVETLSRAEAAWQSLVTTPAAVAQKPDYDYLFKINMIGDARVGKSCLLTRFAADTFTEECIETIGVEFQNQFITIANTDKRAKLQLWDSSGQDRYRTIVMSYCRGYHAILLVYDVSQRQTFQNISGWLEAARKQNSKDTVFILIGAKSDIADSDREISSMEGKDFAAQHGLAAFFETSAKTAENKAEDVTSAKTSIQDVFSFCAAEMERAYLARKDKIDATEQQQQQQPQ